MGTGLFETLKLDFCFRVMESSSRIPFHFPIRLEAGSLGGPLLQSRLILVARNTFDFHLQQINENYQLIKVLM